MYDFEEDGAVAVATGTEAPVATTAGRRRVWVVAVAVVAVAALSVPVAAYALTRGHPPAPVTGGSPAAVTSAPAQPAVGSPAPVGSAAEGGGGAARPGSVAPISQAELQNATLTIPAWPKGLSDGCPSGAVKFSGGRHNEVALNGAPVDADVDHDGVPETMVLVSCSPQGTDYKVLALDRDASGRIVTRGQVVASAGSTGHEGTDIMTIWGIAAGDRGQVRVDVGEYRPCCAMAQASQHQWRSYGWNGSAFTQTGGPTAFGPNPKVTDLRITASPVTMSRQADGSATGTTRMTIHNAAAFATPETIEVYFGVPAGWHVTRDCQISAELSCRIAGLAAGADTVISLTVTAPAGSPTGAITVSASSMDPQDGYDPDTKPEGSRTTIEIR